MVRSSQPPSTRQEGSYVHFGAGTGRQRSRVPATMQCQRRLRADVWYGLSTRLQRASLNLLVTFSYYLILFTQFWLFLFTSTSAYCFYFYFLALPIATDDDDNDNDNCCYYYNFYGPQLGTYDGWWRTTDKIPQLKHRYDSSILQTNYF